MASTINLTKSPTTFSTSVQQKIKSREAALLIKNGSPKLRDLLREVNSGLHFVSIFNQLILPEMSYSDEGISHRLISWCTQLRNAEKGE